VEIAYFDRGPVDPKHLVVGGYWSAYWYGGRLYGSEIVRGLDVFELLPSEHLSGNEIAAARLGDDGGVFNPQQQFPVTWPAEPVVARAYLDQLDREGFDGTLTAAVATALDDLVAGRGGAADKAERLQGLAARLRGLAAQLRVDAGAAGTGRRVGALGETLAALADRVEQH
jgi:hypothetical protein